MGHVKFDTLAYVNKLKAVGVPDRQAVVYAEIIAEVAASNLVAGQDSQEPELHLNSKLRELELRMLIKLGVMVAGIMVLFVVLMKLLHL